MNRRTYISSLVGAASTVSAVSALAKGEEEKSANPELEKVRDLLEKYHEGMSAHDVKAVLATMTKRAAIMGTGPGEIWKGPEEVKDAEEHFFSKFDKGTQHFDYQFKIGDLGKDVGWLMASGNLKAKKDGKDLEVPMNLSLTVEKFDGEWKIAALHFSTFTSADVGKD